MTTRQDGYAAISSYGVLGDGRTAALVARDGRVDWWPVPMLNAPPVFGALLDPLAGGYFSLRPAGGSTCERRYVPGTNVIETTWRTASGEATVTDSLNTGVAGRLPWSELARRVECLNGSMVFDWQIVPGNRFGQAKAYITRRESVPVIKLGDQMLAVVTDSQQKPDVRSDRVSGQIRAEAGQRAIVAVLATDDEPLFISPADDIADRLGRTIKSWQDWSRALPAQGRWQEQVVRSALALKTLLYEPGGAIAAAATTSLPERIGGTKNYDYRYAWARDSSFTLDAFITLGLSEEVHASVSWLLSALRRSGTDLKVFYTLEGDEPEGEAELDLPGYKGSRPVRSGNSAQGQVQLGVYGDLFDLIARYVDAGHVLDDHTSELLSDLADKCCDDWQQKDCGIWELEDRQHYTISKIGCWVAMDRACRLASKGQLPMVRSDRWQTERKAIKEWVQQHCWSEKRSSYTFYAGTDRLDAAVLLAGRTGFDTGERLTSTIQAVTRELARGPMLYRYSGAQHEEGAFLACSFWLVSALAHNGQAERAIELMDEAVTLSNDLGLMSEQIDPSTRDLLGNIPQGLSHLALVNAAHALGSAS